MMTAIMLDLFKFGQGDMPKWMAQLAYFPNLYYNATPPNKKNLMVVF